MTTIENCGIFKYGSNAILRFGIKSIQDSKSDIILQPSQKQFNDGPINIYLPNKDYHNSFKYYMKKSPVFNVDINMYDFFGNNVGRYMKDRNNNNNGGSIEIVSDDITFFSEVINNTHGNSVVYFNKYYPLKNISETLHKQFIEKDFSMMQDNTNLSNIVVFVTKSIYDAIIPYADFFVMFKDVHIIDDFETNYNDVLVQSSVETLFGRVIEGKPSNISKFFKITGGNIVNVLADTYNCKIIHRTNDRIQFMSNSNESECTVVCFLDNVDEDIMIVNEMFDGDNINKPITSQLNVSNTPNLDMVFYHKLFKLKEIVNSFNEKDNKSILIEHGVMVMTFLLDDIDTNYENMNKTEKMMVRYYKDLWRKLNKVFKESQNNIVAVRPPPLLGGGFMGEPMMRQITCAPSIGI